MSYVQNTNSTVFDTHGSPGFTFLEILVALCIVLIALVPLIHLHVTSVHTIDFSSHMARATLVANDRLAEILARDRPELGRSSGRVEDETRDVVYRWTLTVTDPRVPQLESARLMGARQVHVDVVWQDGERQAMVSLDTLVHVAARSKPGIPDNSNADTRNNETALPRTRM
jgi:type II secretion system protein I